ncbi:MAG: TrkA family potassium uptake protein [Sphaerochaetaceae bacterium]|nr:TrkA family potassium uptake protein [Sphaerochaetaceae bacterium]
MKKNQHDPNAYGIIGLGRFGTALALELAKAKKRVVVLDIDEGKLGSVKDFITNAHIVTSISRDVLEESGISHCGTVIVCIGKDIESNILATMHVIECEIPRVISKAMNDDHQRVLEKIGAEVILPEVDSGVRLAKSLLTLRTLDFLELDDDISITEISLSEKFDKKTIGEINFRAKYRLNIIALTRDEKTRVQIGSETELLKLDEIVVIGKNDDISSFIKENSNL